MIEYPKYEYKWPPKSFAARDTRTSTGWEFVIHEGEYLIRFPDVMHDDKEELRRIGKLIELAPKMARLLLEVRDDLEPNEGREDPEDFLRCSVCFLAPCLPDCELNLIYKELDNLK